MDRKHKANMPHGEEKNKALSTYRFQISDPAVNKNGREFKVFVGNLYDAFSVQIWEGTKLVDEFVFTMHDILNYEPEACVIGFFRENLEKYRELMLDKIG